MFIVCFCEAFNAFDKVVHEGMFHELMNKMAPKRLLDAVKALLQRCTYGVRGKDAYISATNSGETG